MARLTPLFALLVTLAVIFGCGGDSESLPASDDATSVSTQQQGQAAEQAEAISSGEALFSNNCSRCHGADLRGTNVGPSLLHEYYEPNHHSNASFVIAVLRGVRQHHWDFGNMPAVEGLEIDDVHAVICFIRQEQLEDGLITEIPTSTPC